MAANGMKGKLEGTGALLSPSALCHYVLKSTPESYKAMVDFYLVFLGARITHGNERITFLTYDQVNTKGRKSWAAFNLRPPSDVRLRHLLTFEILGTS